MVSKAKKDNLTRQQKMWLDTYVENALNGNFNGSDAAKVAYPNCTPAMQRKMAWQCYHHPVIRKRIEEALHDQRMKPDEIWKRWKDMASVDIDDFLTELPDGTPIFDYGKAKELGVTHLIKEFKIDTKTDEDGNVKTYFYDVKFHDAKEALKEVTRLQKMIDQKWISMHLDLSKLPAEAVEAIAAGEDPLEVLVRLHQESD